MKTIRLFKTVEEANNAGSQGMFSPHVDYVRNKSAVNFAYVTTKKFNAEFDNNGHIISKQPIIPTYTVTLTAGEHGTVSGGGVYQEGTVITISASADSGYMFSQWSDGNINNPRQLAVNSDITLGCSFEVRRQKLDEIWYTSTDGNIVTPVITEYFKENIVSNTYDDGQGIIKFDGNVTEIGLGAFYQCSNLLSVVIPSSVTSIGEDAFVQCPNLTSVTIPNSVTTIGRESFALCTSLTNLTIPSSVIEIGIVAFAGCSALETITVDSDNLFFDSRDNCNAIINTSANTLIASSKNTVIPNTVTTIGTYAFGFSNFESFTVPSSITRIEDAAFVYCSNLTGITIPNSVTFIGGSAFGYCSNLTNVTIPSSITSINEHLFVGCTSLNTIEIPNSVTFIDNYSFNSCTNLESIICYPTVPPTLKPYAFISAQPNIYVPFSSLNAYKTATNWSVWADNIYPIQGNDEIFYESSDGNIVTPYSAISLGVNIISNTYNDGIGHIKFDGAITTIGRDAFKYCSTLTVVNIPNSVTYLGNAAFCNSGLIKVNIPNSVTDIDNNVFRECGNLTSLVLPNSVTALGTSIIFSSTSITSFTLSNSLSAISINSFTYCSSLTNINIPSSVTTIMGWAFYGCTSLSNINIPDSVISIEQQAFRYCSNLESVSCLATIPPALGPAVFDNNKAGRKIYVPEESVNTYKAATNWCNYSSYIVPVCNKIYYTTVNGSSLAIYVSRPFGANLVSNTYTDGQGIMLFDGNVTTIPNDVFNSNSNILSVIIPNTVTTISSYAFNYASNLTSCTLSDSLVRIQYGTFDNCSSLTGITIPNSVTSIGDIAFNRCSSLISVTIHNSVTSIGYCAFYGCSSLIEVICNPTTPPTLGNYVFNGNDSNRKIKVPSGSVDAYKTATNWSVYANDIISQ